MCMADGVQAARAFHMVVTQIVFSYIFAVVQGVSGLFRNVLAINVLISPCIRYLECQTPIYALLAYSVNFKRPFSTL